MRHYAIVAVAVLAIVALTVMTADGQQARIGIYSEIGGACEFGLAAPATIGTAYVVLTSSVDLERLRFKISPPPCNGITFLSQQVNPDYVYIGLVQDGIDVTLDACTSPTSGIGIELVRITYIVLGTGTDVCQWTIEPYPGDDMIQVFDCEGFAARGAHNYSGKINQICLIGEYNMIAGYRPTPADGAVNVPTDTQLDWIGPASEIFLADHSFDTVIPGHDHYIDDRVYMPPVGGPYDAPQPFDPGPLEPNTTYHWFIQNVCYGCNHGDSAAGEQWTFTTGDAVATEETTWGRIKSLYR